MKYYVSTFLTITCAFWLLRSCVTNSYQVKSIQLNPPNGISHQLGFLPVELIDSGPVVLESYQPIVDVRGYTAVQSKVKDVFYPWLTDRVEFSKVSFLIFRLKRRDVSSEDEVKLGILRRETEIDGLPLLFRPDDNSWGDRKEEVSIQIPPLSTLETLKTQLPFELAPQ